MNTIEPLTITVRQSEPGHLTLVLSGPCDFETVADLRQAADDALAAAPAPQCLTLDFGAVDTCDSSGLSALIWIRRRTAADDIRLHLDGFNEHQHQVLQITGLNVYLADALNGPCRGHGGDAAATSAATANTDRSTACSP